MENSKIELEPEDNSFEYYQKLKALIHPLAPELTKEQHQLAQCRVAFENLSEKLYDLTNYLKLVSNPEDKTIQWHKQYVGEEKMKQYAISAMNTINEKMDNMTDDDEYWDVFAPNFNYIKDGLKEQHAGDCTAIACTCIRCLAESMYKIDYTANWSKHEGHRLLNEYNKLKKIHSGN